MSVEGEAHDWDALSNCTKCGRGFVGYDSERTIEDCPGMPIPTPSRVSGAAHTDTDWVAKYQAVIDAADAWVDRIKDDPNLWADDEDAALIKAVKELAGND